MYKLRGVLPPRSCYQRQHFCVFVYKVCNILLMHLHASCKVFLSRRISSPPVPDTAWCTSMSDVSFIFGQIRFLDNGKNRLSGHRYESCCAMLISVPIINSVPEVASACVIMAEVEPTKSAHCNYLRSAFGVYQDRRGRVRKLCCLHIRLGNTCMNWTASLK